MASDLERAMEILRECCRAAGGSCSDSVSLEFLKHVPDEIRSVRRNQLVFLALVEDGFLRVRGESEIRRICVENGKTWVFTDRTQYAVNKTPREILGEMGARLI